MHWEIIDLYECELCTLMTHEKELISHVTGKHYSYFYLCFLCSDYEGYRKTDLFQHQRDKHKAKKLTFSCPICGTFISESEKKILNHVKNNHYFKKELFMCKYCSYKSEYENEDHILQSHYTCEFCNYNVICNSPYQLFSHYISYHYPKLVLYYECTECNCMFPQKNSLFQHKRDKHSIVDDDPLELYEKEVVEIRCHLCSYMSQRKNSFSQHFSKKHKNELYSCPFKTCNFESSLFWGLTQHVSDKHLSCKSVYFFCPFSGCEKKCSKTGPLTQHLLDKHRVRRLCPGCDTDQDDLIDHLVSDHELFEEYSSCLLCNEEFEELYELDDHLEEVHHINIPYELRILC